MTNTIKQYDIQEYKIKLQESLKKLEAGQTPGQASKGGKKEVLESIKNELKELVEKGYTSKQIAEAFANDGFGILPKSITQIISLQKTVARKRKAKATEMVKSLTENS